MRQVADLFRAHVAAAVLEGGGKAQHRGQRGTQFVGDRLQEQASLSRISRGYPTASANAWSVWSTRKWGSKEER